MYLKARSYASSSFPPGLPDYRRSEASDTHSDLRVANQKSKLNPGRAAREPRGQKPCCRSRIETMLAHRVVQGRAGMLLGRAVLRFVPRIRSLAAGRSRKRTRKKPEPRPSVARP